MLNTNKVIIIAEAGVNHNGCILTAKKLIDVAAEANVDYIKFQTFVTEKLVSKLASLAEYQIVNNKEFKGNQFEMIKKLELNKKDHIELIDYARIKGINFLSTAFDLQSVKLLLNLGIKLFKIPSGEITNYSYLKKIGGLGYPIILSTGMSNLSDIEAALKVLFDSGLKKKDLIILHCNTEYPTPMEDVNLRAMLTIKSKYKVEVGYSDHTLGTEVPIAAVALGAVCIEKHFTLDRKMKGPDHKASLEPKELIDMVRSIRNIERALGDGIKKPSKSEMKNIIVARKSIHTSRSLKAGHIIEIKDLIALRPGSGISPMEIPKIIGKKLLVDLSKNELLKIDNLA